MLDAQYTLNESFSKFDWGHTSNTMAVNIAVKWKIKNLVLTHHEPAYTDLKLYENFQAATIIAKRCTKHIQTVPSREGLKFRLE